MKRIYIHIYLILLLSGLAIFANTSYLYSGELSLSETIQNTFLVLIIFLHIKYRKLFCRYSNNFLFYARLFIFVLVLYEEISFITKNISNFFNFHNSQQEINIHNLRIINEFIISNFPVPFLGYQVNLTYFAFFLILVSFIFGFGAYLPYLKKINFFFLEREYSLYSLVYLSFVIVNSLSKHKFNYLLNVDFEFFELFIYNVLLIDSVEKVLKMKNKNLNLLKRS